MQNINLLNDMPKEKVVLSASMLFKIVIIFICGLLAISVWQWSSLLYQYQYLHRVEKKYKETKQHFMLLVKQNPILTKNKSMLSAINNLNGILKVEKFKFDSLSHKALISGFSKYLRLFASRVPDSISLKGFSISNIKSNIALYGEALSAKDVSSMVEQLYLSPLFDSVTFDKYVLSLDENKIKFEVATNYLVNEGKVLSSIFEKGKIKQQILMKAIK